MKGFYLLTIIITIIIIIIIISLFNCLENNSYSEYFINNDTSNLTIVLIGDSVLNNSNYIKNGEKSTFQHLNDIINNKYTRYISLYNYAEDGATINDCFRQIDKIQLDIIDKKSINDNNYSNLYIVLSCGGNDILNYSITNNNNNIFLQLNQLESKFITLIKTIQTKFPLVNIFLLNLYYPLNSKFNFYKKIIEEWNNKIINICSKSNKCKLIDIFSIINSKSDFIYDIEPSSIGGKKIASIIKNNI